MAILAERDGSGTVKMHFLRPTEKELPPRTVFWPGLVFEPLLEYLIELT